MKLLGMKYWVSLLVVWTWFACTPASTIRVDTMKCEALVNPLAIDNTSPHFSWQLHSGEPGEKQTAYQVLVASDEALLM